MSSTIQIKFLSLDEMANAASIDPRYENVGIDNLGFADKEKNRVFVRAGLEPQLQKILIDHELSHLFELEGTDEDEHGIRHKKKGGFLSWFVPVVTAIVGSALGGWGLPAAAGLSAGSLAGGTAAALGAGAGSTLGGAAGSSMVGKPNWGSNAIGGAGAAVGSGLSGALGGMFPSGSTSSKVASGFGSMVGQGGTQLGLGMLTSPSSKFGYNSFDPSGWSDQVAMPTQPSNIGELAAPTSTSAGDRSGVSKMPMDPGLSQAGIDLGSSNRPTQGFTNMFQSMGNLGAGMEYNPTGYDISNGGMFAI